LYLNVVAYVIYISQHIRACRQYSSFLDWVHLLTQKLLIESYVSLTLKSPLI
jgi:hypothetical protein